MWSSKVDLQPEGKATKIKCRVIGQYDIYCGSGGMHREHIKTQDSVWDTEAGQYTRDYVSAHAGDEEAARRIAEALIQWELEDWTDSCEDGDDSCL